MPAARHQRVSAARAGRERVLSAAIPRRVALGALGAWSAFIVYGSFIPFRLDPRSVRLKVALFQLYPFQRGVWNFSVLDVVANVLLFVPFGVLLAAGARASRSWPARVVTTLFAAALFSAAIEAGQLFTAGRVSSAVDVEANAVGALLGALLAWWLLTRAGHRVEAIAHAVRSEPRLLAITVVLISLCASSFYPFEVTLDKKTFQRNLGRAYWSLALPAGKFWADLVMEQTVVHALLAALLTRALERFTARARAAPASFAFTAALAVLLEAGKLLMVGRAPNVMNVVFALPGAAIGAFVVPRIVGAARFKPVRDWAVLALALSFLTYAELTPFTFTLSPIVVREQIASIEWMPFLSYFYVDPRQALLDVWNKILLGGFLGFALTRLSGARWAGTVGGLAAGLLLEALQLLTFVRRASVTDVLMLTIAAWIGGWLERRYRVERQAAHPLAEDYEFNALRGRL